MDAALAATEPDAEAWLAPPAPFGDRLPDAPGPIPPRLLAAWRDLVPHASEPNCFLEPWFVAASLRHLAKPGAVRLIDVWDGDLLLGVMPVVIESGYARLPMRFVRTWRHHHCFLGTPLVRAGHELDFWTGALTFLDTADWAPAVFHLNNIAEDGPVHRGLAAAAAVLGRPAPIVYRHLRAALASDLTPEAYYERSIRKKKRKELKRLRNRLDELGSVTFARLQPREDLARWCDSFLALERSGWKGDDGSALADDPATAAFFRDALAGAHNVGRLEMLRLDVGGRTIAMLVNFLTPPGSFSFKIAYDEDYARFSPGVLLQIENLAILDRADIAWMDSCAAQDHPMIDSFWSKRRSIVRVSVPLKGVGRRVLWTVARLLERRSDPPSTFTAFPAPGADDD